MARRKRRKVRSSKRRRKSSKRKARKGKGRVPLKILERRAVKLVKIVRSRGGKVKC